MHNSKITDEIAKLSAKLDEGWDQNQLVIKETKDQTTGEPYLDIKRNYLNIKHIETPMLRKHKDPPRLIVNTSTVGQRSSVVVKERVPKSNSRLINDATSMLKLNPVESYYSSVKSDRSLKLRSALRNNQRSALMSNESIKIE